MLSEQHHVQLCGLGMKLLVRGASNADRGGVRRMLHRWQKAAIGGIHSSFQRGTTMGRVVLQLGWHSSDMVRLVGSAVSIWQQRVQRAAVSKTRSASLATSLVRVQKVGAQCIVSWEQRVRSAPPLPRTHRPTLLSTQKCFPVGVISSTCKAIQTEIWAHSEENRQAVCIQTTC